MRPIPEEKFESNHSSKGARKKPISKHDQKARELANRIIRFSRLDQPANDQEVVGLIEDTRRHLLNTSAIRKIKRKK